MAQKLDTWWSKVHQIWVGDPAPPWIASCMRGWRELNERFTYAEWGEAELADLDMHNRKLYDNAERYAMHGRVHQFRSDIARYEILWQYGGTYVDSDFEVIDKREIGRLLQRTDPWMTWESQGQWVANALMHFPPRHPFVGEAIEQLHGHVARLVSAKKQVSTSRLSGPRYVTRLYRRTGSEAPSILDERLFYPYGWNQLDQVDGDYGDAIAVHHFGNQRRIQGKDLIL